MGSNNTCSDNKDNKTNNKSMNTMNTYTSLKGDINCYICGNINTFLNCEDGFNFTASRNFYLLEQIFEKSYQSKNGNIQLNNKEMYYQYEFRKKEKNAKHYNALLILNKADEEFFDMLFEHLYEVDKSNKNKNVIIFFGEDKDVIKSLNKLYKKSKETAPILVIINSNSKYSDKLKYVNYIPDLDTIFKFLKEKKTKLSDDELSSLSEKALVNYINMKLFRIDMYYNQLGYNLNIINPMNETYLKIKMTVTVALLGYSGCGKSTLINLLFNELVARTSTSATDVTTECSEYYFPIQDTKEEDIGQIRFLDFPGITEADNYKKIIEPKIKQKMKEFKDKMEQIDVALFFINNGNNRELNETGKTLLNLLYEQKIKIIFVINGDMKPFVFETKKEKLRNAIENKEILYEDLSNIIHTNFYQYFKESDKTGISKIFEKIIDACKIKDKNFRVEDINVANYNEKLYELSKSNRVFELYSNMDAIKEKAKTKANLCVAGYSTLALGSSSLSLVVPLVDCGLTIGYEVAMVYTIFSIYELDPKDYNIVTIVITGGETIEEKVKNKKKITTKGNKDKNNGNDKSNNNNVAIGNIKEIAKDASNAAVFAGHIGIKNVATKEAGKAVIEKTVQTVVTDTIEAAAIKTTANTVEAVVVNAVEKTVTNTVEKIVVESSKELAEKGLVEGTKIAVEVAKDAAIIVAEEGGEQIIVAGTKESVKAVTEQIVIQQGGRTWLVNLGKAVPFIGAAISAVMNTYSTAKLGKNLVNKFDKEFDNNQQRKVDLLKGRIYGLLNIIQQMKAIIEDENNNPNF